MNNITYNEDSIDITDKNTNDAEKNEQENKDEKKSDSENPFLGFGPKFDVKENIINYNEKFIDDLPIKYRDDPIRDTLSILIGNIKPNPLLVGPAGSGKTKIVEDIARMLANNDSLIPDALKNYTIYELPLSSLVAGAGIVGELENRVSAIIDFITDTENKAILFIDEAHLLLQKDSVYSKIAQQLKPALARSNMHLIAATTTQEISSFMDDPAFSRRFSRVIVDELSKQETLEIITDYANTYEKKYGIFIPKDICEEIVQDADMYRHDITHRPDNAITLLDRSVCQKIVTKKNNVLLAPDTQKKENVLTEEDIRNTAILLMTGHSKQEDVELSIMQKDFSKIKGQKEVIDFIGKMIQRRKLNLFPLERPTTLLFAGASGVGKTEVVKIFAKRLTGSFPIILNMTEYQASNSINRIIGSPAGYEGFDSNQELPFDILDTNPYQVVLLDEFEKCNRSVQRLFMSVFDEGTLKTNRGKTIDFSKAIIIATTNAGFCRKSAQIGFDVDETPKRKKSDLEDYFDIELLNRFSDVIWFNSIDKNTYKEIMKDTYRKMVAEIKLKNKKYPLLDEIPEEDVDRLTEASYEEKLGARPIRTEIQKYIEDKCLEF